MTNVVKKNNKDIKKYSTSDLEEGFVTHFATFINSAANNFALMAWAHFRGSSFYLGNVLIPMIVSLGVAAFMYMTFGLVWVLFITLTFTGLATYGTVFFSIRKSSLIKNINLTTTETGPLYFATFILLGVSLFMTINIIILWLFILDEFGFLMQTLTIGGPNQIPWEISWIKVYTSNMLWFYLVEQVFLCFSISFFIEKVVETQKNFFMVVFAYILAGIFFSGIMSNGLYINESGTISVVNENTTIGELDGINAVPQYMWGTSLWTIGQLFPHYGANQLVAPVAQSASTWVNGDGIIEYNRWYNISILKSIDSWDVRYYAIMPWAWSIALVYVSSMLERYNKHQQN